jgi:CRISPR-associated protein Csb1
MELSHLSDMVANDAALRRRQRLQPVGGAGDKIFPPTYPAEAKGAPPLHVFELRRIGGADVWTVLVDSVQSQANRLEECLRDAIGGDLHIPHALVDFSGAGLAGIDAITSFDAPHRIYDAILRDSSFEGRPFLDKDGAFGKRLLQASAADASALLEVSPNALLFGAWNSTGQGGGLGAKFARSLTSEIMAIDVPTELLANQRTGELTPRTLGRRTGSRIDPLGVIAKVPLFKSAEGWHVSKELAGRGAKESKPSEVNHGNIRPNVMPLGVTCDHLEHSFVLSFAGLRRLRFGADARRDAAARGLLAALGLLALAEQDARGYALRSRCDLVCDGAAPLELVHPDGSTKAVALDRTGARALYQAAFRAASEAGFALGTAPLRLTPQDKLVQIVRKSQELALSGAGEGADDDGTGT